MKNKYILGIDLGITSVGYGIIEKETLDIIKYGVRLFDEADAENNIKRRTKRSARRMKRRKTNRIIEMKRLVFKNIISKENYKPLSNVYELRVKGLTQKLSGNELASVLIHLVKKRGSNFEVVDDGKEKDDEILKDSLKNNVRELAKRNLYVCQLQLERLYNNSKVKGFNNAFKTEDYVKEVKQILINQDLGKELNEKIVNIISRRRMFSDGPGDENSPTPYGRYRLENGIIKKYNLIDIRRGKCSVYSEEFRAAKNSFTACLFNLLNDLNNMKIKSDGEKRDLTKEEKEKVINHVKETGKIDFDKTLKILNFSVEDISGCRVDRKNKFIISEFPGYAKFVSIAKKNKEKDIINVDFVDEAIEILTKNKIKEQRITDIEKIITKFNLKISKESVDAISDINGINGYHSLSYKAMKEISNEMLNSSSNSEMIIHANGLKRRKSFQGYKDIQFDDELILSPVSKRAHREAIKVINELRNEYGEFDTITIETTRDKNSTEQRKRIKDIQKTNEENRAKATNLAKELNVTNLNLKQIIKLRLYNEQQQKCIYTGNPIDLNVLLNDDSAYQIEHIIPYSISFDNSLSNKALAEGKANSLKGQKTPYYYFKSGRAYGVITNFSDYSVFVNGLNLYKKKKENLLTEDDYSKFSNVKQFINRNLNDTSYAIKSLMTTLKNYFNDNNIETVVRTIRGKVTSDFRKKGDLNKNRDFYIHHAIDALIIAALTNNKTINAVLNKNDNDLKIDIDTGEVLSDPLDDQKLNQFLYKLKLINNSDLNISDPHLFSWKVDKKIGRQLFDETLYSTRKVDDKEYVVKKYKDIYGEGGEKLTKAFEKGEENKLLMAKNDIKTFEILKNIYNEYKGLDSKGKKIKNVFKYYYEITGEKIRKYSKKGNGTIIENIKCLDAQLKSHYDISQNYHTNNKVVLKQITPYRTDIYMNRKGNYKFLTVRMYHIKKENSKNIIPLNLYEELKNAKDIDDTYDFIFSLNRNNIIKIIESTKAPAYYRFVGTNSDVNNIIECKNIHKETDANSRIKIYIGKNTKLIEKFDVSPCGKWKKRTKEVLQLEFKDDIL